MVSILAENNNYPENLFYIDLERGKRIIRKGRMQPENQKMFLREQGQSQGQGSKLGDESVAAALTAYQSES